LIFFILNASCYFFSLSTMLTFKKIGFFSIDNHYYYLLFFLKLFCFFCSRKKYKKKKMQEDQNLSKEINDIVNRSSQLYHPGRPNARPVIGSVAYQQQSQTHPFYSQYHPSHQNNFHHNHHHHQQQQQQQQQQQMTGTLRYSPAVRPQLLDKPPPNYRCHRCGSPEHYIQACPTNGNVMYDKPTRVPSQTMDQMPGLGVGPVPALVPDQAMPHQFKCLVCGDIIKQALTVSCCYVTYCSDCVLRINSCACCDSIIDDSIRKFANPRLQDVIDRHKKMGIIPKH